MENRPIISPSFLRQSLEVMRETMRLTRLTPEQTLKLEKYLTRITPLSSQEAVLILIAIDIVLSGRIDKSVCVEGRLENSRTSTKVVFLERRAR